MDKFTHYLVCGGGTVFFVVFVIRALAFLRFRLTRIQQPKGSYKVKMGKTMAHRGGRETTPENTMSAFVNALKFVDSIELDVWLTKDNKVVVLHDGTLARCCESDKHVMDCLYSELPMVKPIPSEDYLQGSLNSELPKQEKIPLLSDVLDLLTLEENKTKTALIEFKQDSEILIRSVLAMLDERDLLKEKRICWFSLKYGINNKLGALAPHVPRGPSVLQIIFYALSYRLGVLNLTNFYINAFGITCGTKDSLLHFISKIPVLKYLPTPIMRILASWYISVLSDPGLFVDMRKRGLECWVLGVNSEEDYQFALKMGAESIITDRPEWLHKVIYAKEN